MARENDTQRARAYLEPLETHILYSADVMSAAMNALTSEPHDDPTLLKVLPESAVAPQNPFARLTELNDGGTLVGLLNGSLIAARRRRKKDTQDDLADNQVENMFRSKDQL